MKEKSVIVSKYTVCLMKIEIKKTEAFVKAEYNLHWLVFLSVQTTKVHMCMWIFWIENIKTVSRYRKYTWEWRKKIYVFCVNEEKWKKFANICENFFLKLIVINPQITQIHRRNTPHQHIHTHTSIRIRNTQIHTSTRSH